VKSKNDWMWQPPGETIDAIASVLSAHWTAAKSQQMQLFSLPTSNWLRQSSWLRQPLGKLSWLSQLPWRGETPWRSPLTTLQVAADSSDTLPDPHPC
jgi:hypothetical protein